jgi:hypothetical protein
MTRRIAALLIWSALLIGSAFAANDTRGMAPLAASFTRRYTGELDYKHKVRLTLTRNRNRLTGRYAYTRVGKPLVLQGSLTGPEFKLEEFDNGRRSGRFEGTYLTPTVLSGIWHSEDGKRMMDARLEEIPPKEKRPFTGSWSWENQGAQFSLDLIQRGNTVEGSYNATTTNARRVDADSAVSGTVRGNVANVRWISGYGNNHGTSRITRVGNSLRWQVLTDGVGGYYAPQRATLHRDK